ncbi:MAG: GNAT family N-acetyltransferase [Desertimonas sp.]
MRSSTRERVRAVWSRAVGVSAEDLVGGGCWVVTRPEAAGLVVGRLDDALVVVCPTGLRADVDAIVERDGTDALMQPEVWLAAWPERAVTLSGPTVHCYRDDVVGLGRPDHRVQVAPPGFRRALDRLERTVAPEEWREAGFDDPGLVFTLHDDHRLVAAAHLSVWDGHLTDMGFITGPRVRGRGYGTVVAVAAAHEAISRHGVARWRTRASNLASLAVSRRLGFEPMGTNLRIRFDDDTAAARG